MGSMVGPPQEPCPSTSGSDNFKSEVNAPVDGETAAKESQDVQPDLAKKTPASQESTSRDSSDDLSGEVTLKNIEIRRMSATEEGDRILNDAWTSPDKDDHGKTPLEMVENIVSNIASSSPSTPSATVASSGASSPSASGEMPTTVKTKNTKSVRTQLLANMAQMQQQQEQAKQASGVPVPSQPQQQSSVAQQPFPVTVQNSGGQQQTHPHPQPPPPHPPPPVHLQPQPPQAPHVVPPPQQPVMQLVNTINGPMLMQAIPISGATGGLVQLPALTSMPTAGVTTQPSNIASTARPIQPAPPTMQRREVPDLRKKGKKKKTTTAGSNANAPSAAATRTTPVPILMSPAVPVSGPSIQPTPPGGGQLVAIGRHTTTGMAPHQGIIQPANIVLNPTPAQPGGPVMAAVAAAPSNQVFLSNNAILPVQGVVFGQIPDGSLYPMQPTATPGAISPSTMAPIQLVPGGTTGQQPLIGGGPFSNSGPILVNGPNGPQQLIPASNAPPGTFILAQPTAGQQHPGYIQSPATATVPVSQQQLLHQRQQQHSNNKIPIEVLGNPRQIDDRRRSSTASSSSGSTSSSSDASSQLDTKDHKQNQFVQPSEFARKAGEDKEEEEDVEEEMDGNDEGESDSDGGEAVTNDNILVEKAKTDERDSDEEEDEEEEDEDDEDEEEEQQQLGVGALDVAEGKLSPNRHKERKDEPEQGPSSGHRQLRRAAATPPRRSPRKSAPNSPSKSSPKTTTTFIQSNKVDSSGLRATPPHAAADLDASSSSFAMFNDSGATQNEEEDDDDDEEPEGSGLDTSGGTEASGEVGSSGDGDSSRKRRRRRKRNAEQILRDDLSGMLGKSNIILPFATRKLGKLIADDSDASPTPSTSTAGDGGDPSASSSWSSSAVPRSFSAGDVVWGPCSNFPSWPGKLLEDARVTKDLVAEPESARVCWFGSKEESVVPVASLKDLSDGLEAHHKERKRLRK